MRNPAVQGRADSNQSEIAQVYRRLGFSVIDLHSVGFGCPDLLASLASWMGLIECKTEGGTFTTAQVRFNRDWRGAKPTVIRSVDEALAHATEVRKRIYGGFRDGNEKTQEVSQAASLEPNSGWFKAHRPAE